MTKIKVSNPIVELDGDEIEIEVELEDDDS